ncbi:MAG: glycine zipper 2TM domain-containing protein [Desulfarculus sp.]|nr:glycine zipper 2TM domain-containing protein [Desulfarculus sp.]
MGRITLPRFGFVVLLCLALTGAGCSLYQPSKAELQGGAVGAATGAVAGALLDSWRGGVIGAAIGAVAGATITHIATRASNEAAAHKKPVSYSNQSGSQRVEAHPVSTSGNCTKVVEKFYENGQLVRTEERQVCK